MSYAYKLSKRALAGMSRIPIWLQEETLDELDLLADRPPISGRRIGEAIIHDFVRDRGPDRFYVFITIFPDAATLLLRISDVGSYSRNTHA